MLGWSQSANIKSKVELQAHVDDMRFLIAFLIALTLVVKSYVRIVEALLIHIVVELLNVDIVHLRQVAIWLGVAVAAVALVFILNAFIACMIVPKLEVGQTSSNSRLSVLDHIILFLIITINKNQPLMKLL